jgi:hypothetical protein
LQDFLSKKDEWWERFGVYELVRVKPWLEPVHFDQRWLFCRSRRHRLELEHEPPYHMGLNQVWEEILHQARSKLLQEGRQLPPLDLSSKILQLWHLERPSEPDLLRAEAGIESVANWHHYRDELRNMVFDRLQQLQYRDEGRVRVSPELFPAWELLSLDQIFDSGYISWSGEEPARQKWLAYSPCRQPGLLTIYYDPLPRIGSSPKGDYVEFEIRFMLEWSSPDPVFLQPVM